MFCMHACHCIVNVFFCMPVVVSLHCIMNVLLLHAMHTIRYCSQSSGSCWARTDSQIMPAYFSRHPYWYLLVLAIVCAQCLFACLQHTEA